MKMVICEFVQTSCSVGVKGLRLTLQIVLFYFYRPHPPATSSSSPPTWTVESFPLADVTVQRHIKQHERIIHCPRPVNSAESCSTALHIRSVMSLQQNNFFYWSFMQLLSSSCFSFCLYKTLLLLLPLSSDWPTLQEVSVSSTSSSHRCRD